MKITCLIENSAQREDVSKEHGLSLYIETNECNILMDTGASDGFISNAEILNTDIKKADAVVLSHGHYDHGGGLAAYIEMCSDKKIYLRKNALEPHYHISKDRFDYIGLDECLNNAKGLCFTSSFEKITKNASVFSDVKGKRYPARGNKYMFVKRGGRYIQDDFSHEQSLAVNSGKTKVLISGCAHSGVLNILDRYFELFGCMPDAVISGFHLMQKDGYTKEDLMNIKNISGELKKTGIVFYTGHCTGSVPYEIMEGILENKLVKISTGSVICLP